MSSSYNIWVNYRPSSPSSCSPFVTFVFLSGVFEVQLLDTANLSLDSSNLDDDLLDGEDSSVFLFSNVQLAQQVRLDKGPNNWDFDLSPKSDQS